MYGLLGFVLIGISFYANVTDDTHVGSFLVLG